MIQKSCINWGQVFCEYYNVRDYDWNDNENIYLVEEKYADEEHTLFEFVGVRYYICEKCYKGFIAKEKDFFKFVEKILYKKGMDLDSNKNFEITSTRFVELRAQKQLVDENFKTLRFNKEDLIKQRDMLMKTTDEDYNRLFREFNESPLRSIGREAINISLKDRIKLINLIVENLK